MNWYRRVWCKISVIRRKNTCIYNVVVQKLFSSSIENALLGGKVSVAFHRS
jgi:hypothetical protein